jgi:hypothetical protein
MWDLLYASNGSKRARRHVESIEQRVLDYSVHRDGGLWARVAVVRHQRIGVDDVLKLGG